MTPIAGRYTLMAPLGRGSMGTVYEAYDEHLDRRVALKRIQEPLIDETSIRRFRREARLAARINHPGVPATYDLDNEYLTMEYIDGTSLRDVIAEAAPLAPQWVAAIGLQIAAVLACAHRVSLIHRDLKPSNLLLTRDGAVKVIDFGVAALGADAALSTLTPAGVVIGTASYQAPERLLGLYSPRSDLYSLGCVLRELSGGTSALADELTVHNPEDRPHSADEVIARLLPSLDSQPPVLPALTSRGADVSGMTHAYLALINSSPSVAHSPVPADLRKVRSQADRLIAADQHVQAAALLTAAIDSTPQSPLHLDLRRDLARVLLESGNFAQSSIVFGDLIPDLSARLGRDHAAVLQARSNEAQAIAHSGSASEALRAFELLLPDLERLLGPKSRESLSCRRSIAVLHAVSGEPLAAVNELSAVRLDQEQALGRSDPDVLRTVELLGIASAIAKQ